MLAKISVRMAIAASPAPRNTALMRNSRNTLAFPPSITWVKPVPVRMTDSEAPRIPRSWGANVTPRTASTPAMTSPSPIACTAARAAPSGFFSPMRRATVAAAPIDAPMASV